MAVGVVDGLEAVEIDEEHRSLRVEALGVAECLGEHLTEVATIRETRQCVVQREML